MMASRILSRFLPGAESEVPEFLEDDTVENTRMGAAKYPHGDVSFHDDFDNHALDDMLLEAGEQSITHPEPKSSRRGSSNEIRKDMPAPQWVPPRPMTREEEDDVPASLIMETRRDRRAHSNRSAAPRPVSSSRIEAQWWTAQHEQRLHFEDSRPGRLQAQGTNASRPVVNQFLNVREQALWRWLNTTNVDGFLLEVYQYYADHGIWSILLSRVIYILTTAFLFSMYMFLSSCIDFAKIPHSKSTSEVLIPQCMQQTSFLKSVMLWLFVFWWTSTIFRYVVDMRRLWHIHEFFDSLLGITEIDIQAVPWERVVEGLMSLRNANPETAETLPRYVTQTRKKTQSKQRMDAHDIANRLMRRDNYYIAMINKEILDLSLPVPFFGSRQFYSKSLEWCIGFCFENFIFDDHGHVQKACLDSKNRNRMIEALRRRLRFAAIISVAMAPFNIGAHCIYYISRYYAEFRNSPSQLGARAFTPLAEWKLREFNELEIDFRRRMKMAYPFADRYLNQFPKDKTNQVMQFVSLVTGTVAAVLGIATLLDPELFLGFEITSGRTAFFYLSISMAVFAAARGAVPDDVEVHDPVLHLFEVIEYTHYFPQRWKKQLHSNNVRVEFSALYQMKILIFLEEILSLIVAPFILWRNSGQQSKQIIDFFRQFTVHVDGLGPLCNHAVFDFRKRKNVEDDDAGKDAEDLRNEYFNAKDDKMAMSQYYFMQRLGQYDQQQASRYQRQHQNMPLPPSFPPLSPMQEAANKIPPSGNNSKPAAQPSLRSPSPHQSILLDLQQKRHPTHPRRQGTQGHSRPDKSRQAAAATMATAAAQDEHVPTNPFADLTTSRLIEQDNDLADSWKAEEERELEGLESAEVGGAGQGNGVLGLLVEFSKAHAEGKGGRRGSKFG